MARDVLLAAIVGAQGLKGAVRVKVFTETPTALAAYGPLHDAQGTLYEIVRLKPGRPGEAVVGFKGVCDRAAAEALRGVELFVDRARLPPAGAEEFYHADLVGLAAWDGEGRILGRVAAVHNYGAGDVLEIARPDGDSMLLAFTHDTVPVIDIAGGRVTVALPEDEEEGGGVE